MGLIVAIDGPAGSGKSTVAKEVARRLRFSYVDTGAIYRSLAYCSILNNISESDVLELSRLAENLPLEIATNQIPQRYLLDKKDISDLIRTEKISRLASVVSTYKDVRDKLLHIQRRLGNESQVGAVLEGRDIGTVVFPNANFKFFLTASNEVRAQRRFEELMARGEPVDLDSIKRRIVERDDRDSKRDVAPMMPAQDAVFIDTSLLSLDEVTNQIVGIVNGSN